LEDLEGGLLEYETIGEFLTDTRKKFGEGDCYDLKSLEWNKRTNSCIRVNTRKLNRELFTK